MEIREHCLNPRLLLLLLLQLMLLQLVPHRVLKRQPIERSFLRNGLGWIRRRDSAV